MEPMKKYVALGILLVVFFLKAETSNSTKSMTIEVGGETLIRVQDLKGISNPGDIVEDVVLSDGNSFKVRGMAWGDTQITAWDLSGNQYTFNIHVDMPKFVRELQGFLEEIEGVNVNFLGKNIIVEGQLLRKTDESKLQGILTNFSQVKNMVNMAIPDMTKLLTEAVKAELYNMDLKFSFLGEGLMYEGIAYFNEAKDKAKSVGAFYFGSVYPAVDVKAPDLNLDMYLLDYKPRGSESSGPFAVFMNALKNKEYKGFVPFTFFDSKSIEQALDKINAAGLSNITSKACLKGQSSGKILWEDSGGGLKLVIEILPRVIEPGWMDLRFTVNVREGTANIFTKTERLILKNSQPVAVTGLVQLLKAEVPQSSRLAGIPSIAPFFGQDSGSELILVFSPYWKLKD